MLRGVLVEREGGSGSDWGLGLVVGWMKVLGISQMMWIVLKVRDGHSDDFER